MSDVPVPDWQAIARDLAEALNGLIAGATEEFNEKGAGGFALARLVDARIALRAYDAQVGE